MLSVIIPAYNEQEIIEKTNTIISRILKNEKISYTLIFVDDGSKDNTWERIKKISDKQQNVHGIHFSRNFGKEAAILAGLAFSKGECCVVIDCDLQHPPEKIVEMYRLWEQGYEVIEGRKSNRGNESKLHSFAAKSFYSLISFATGFDMENASDFKLLDQKAVNVLINMPEKNAFFRALSTWIGFNTTQIEFDVQNREAGESKWSTVSLIKYAVRNIASFSTAPMQIVTIIIILLISSSIIMVSLGVIGFYIAKIYEEIKGRPRYIISDTCGGCMNENKVI